MLLLCLLLLPFSALAKESARTYTIKRGDTLWGISERFLKDPYYWPNLWANNPFVSNPHFIYPGQKIRIYDGRIEIVPVQAEKEAVTAETPEVPVSPAAPAEEMTAALPEPQESITIKAPGGEGFVTLEDLDSAGVLVDTVDNRILMASGDQVFLKLNDPSSVSPGEPFALFRLGREVEHPVTGEPLGYQVVSLGALQVTDIDGAVATAKITVAHEEIQRGDRLLPLPPARSEVVLKKAARELSGYLVAAKGDQVLLGQYDVIYVDLGSDDGLEAGNLLDISRSREATELALEEDIQLPDVLLGSAVVLETRAQTATALVLKSADALQLGDKVSTVTP
jgi:LysM repeat protein